MTHSAAALTLATALVARFKDLCVIDQGTGAVLHAGMAVGAASEYFNANTGGFIWVSQTVHRAEDGTLVHVQAGNDSCGAYVALAETAAECDELLYERCGETDDIVLAEGDYDFPYNDSDAQRAGLQQILERWTTAEGLPLMSAADLRGRAFDNPRQYAWLSDFIAEWDKLTD